MGRGSPLLNRQEKTSLVVCCGGYSLAVLQTFANIQGILVCVVWVDWVEHTGYRQAKKELHIHHPWVLSFAQYR